MPQSLPINDAGARVSFPFNSAIAAELKELTDGCGMISIKRYFRSPLSEIESVVIIQEPYVLHEVAAFLVEPPSPVEAFREEYVRLLRAGVFKLGVDDRSVLFPALWDYSLLLDDIPDDQECRALYTPPTYIIQVTERKWD